MVSEMRMMRRGEWDLFWASVRTTAQRRKFTLDIHTPSTIYHHPSGHGIDSFLELEKSYMLVHRCCCKDDDDDDDNDYIA